MRDTARHISWLVITDADVRQGLKQRAYRREECNKEGTAQEKCIKKGREGFYLQRVRY